MAKGQYKEWLQKEKLVLLQGWKRNGLTDDEIAHNMGINPRTLYRWKNKYSQFSQALKIGKQEANFIVENELLKTAMSGNTTAMIFWLKNNYREKYADSHKTPEEQRVDKAKIAKLEADAIKAKAEADIAKAQADSLNRVTNASAEKIAKLTTDELRQILDLNAGGADSDTTDS